MRGSISELLVIALIIGIFLLVYGVKKIPELARSLREAKQIMTEPDDKDDETDTAKAIESKDAVTVEVVSDDKKVEV